MRWWQRIFNRQTDSPLRIKLIADRGDWYHAWDGSIYKCDIVRAAIRPKVKAVGKLMAMHIRETAGKMSINPEPYLRLLLEEPNPYSSGQMFRERLAALLSINNNAFAAIFRDEDGFPTQIYPVPAVMAEAIRTDDGRLFLRFQLARGGVMTLPYSDVIHLRDDYVDNDIFGCPKAEALQSLLEIINASDQSVVNAVKRSAVIRWIMRFKAQLKPEDRKQQVKEFVNDFLSAENEGGAVASDPRYDLDQVKDNTFVPSSPHQQRAVERIYSFFGVNQKIVQASYNEDEWLAYFESEIQPLAQQMGEEFSRKLFTRRERGFGNRIVFDTTSLAYASMKTKLALVSMVDRGAMVPNEWRRVLNLPPIEGGDKPIRRLDTAEVDERTEGDTEDVVQDRRSGLWLPRGLRRR